MQTAMHLNALDQVSAALAALETETGLVKLSGRVTQVSSEAIRVSGLSRVVCLGDLVEFEGRSGLKTWLHRIVANRCKNRLRSTKREVSTDFSEALEPELGERFNARGRWDLPPKLQFHDSADTLMENGALSDCLDKHLSALPETQRSALMLYEAHQHKSDDVCNILDVSASNLRVLLHRARQKIFLMVETFQETGEC